MDIVSGVVVVGVVVGVVVVMVVVVSGAGVVSTGGGLAALKIFVRIFSKYHPPGRALPLRKSAPLPTELLNGVF